MIAKLNSGCGEKTYFITAIVRVTVKDDEEYGHDAQDNI